MSFSSGWWHGYCDGWGWEVWVFKIYLLWGFTVKAKKSWAITDYESYEEIEFEAWGTFDGFSKAE
ncbi:MAG: hypothetical protein CM15mP106_1310 [Candidatus Neomarinimicrobiota bacterium]|nr:MAG: hypothetical protein CM15mP106_1310 [Candidatus Neomarinimicrobiota bacterium]